MKALIMRLQLLGTTILTAISIIAPESLDCWSPDWWGFGTWIAGLPYYMESGITVVFN